MTTIAWDGKTLAADKRSTSAGLARTVTKIFRHEGKLLGISGSFDYGMQVVEWFKAGAEPEKFPACQLDKDDWSTLVVIDASGVGVYERGPFLLRNEDPSWATGSGRDYAMAAMHCGKSAAEAVAVAAAFDVGTGNGIDTLEL